MPTARGRLSDINLDRARRRDRRADRRLGLRQDHALRLVAGLDRASAGRIRLDGEVLVGPASGRRHRVPGAAPAALAVGCRQHRLRPRRRERCGTQGARCACARQDRLVRACRALAARSLGRPAAARRHRARFRHQPEGAAPRRAVLGARRLHPRQPARASARAVGRDAPDRGARHARRAGGGDARGSRRRDAAEARPHLRRTAAHARRVRATRPAFPSRPPCAAS